MGKNGFEFGTIKTWFEHDAFGFVRRDADPDGDQVFVHVTQTGQRLPPGTRVRLNVIDTPRGLRGLNVEAVKEAMAQPGRGTIPGSTQREEDLKPMVAVFLQ